MRKLYEKYIEFFLKYNILIVVLLAIFEVFFISLIAYDIYNVFSLIALFLNLVVLSRNFNRKQGYYSPSYLDALHWWIEKFEGESEDVYKNACLKVSAITMLISLPFSIIGAIWGIIQALP